MWVPRHVCGSKKGESPEQGRVLLIFQSREGVGMWALGCSGAASGNFEFWQDQVPQHLSKPSSAVLAPVPEAQSSHMPPLPIRIQAVSL